MVWPNKTARPWEFRCGLDSSESGTGVYATASGVSVVNWNIPWGVPYSPGNHCIYLQLSLDFGAGTWQITYQVPMAFTGAATSGTLASGVGLPSLQAYVAATDWFISVDANCNWALSGSITLKYSTDNGTIMSGPTFTVVNENGSGFDKRYAADYVDLTIPYVDTLAVYGGFGAPICYTTETTEVANDGTKTATGTVIWGWHYENDAGTAWQADGVAWDNGFGSDSGCACHRSPINVTGIDSWSNTAVLNSYWERSITADGSWSQTCTVRGKPTTSSGTWWDVLLRENFDILGFAKAAPSNYGIPITERTVTSGCNGVIDVSSDITTTEPVTYSSYHKTVGNGIGHQTCHTGAFLVGCPPPITITSDGCGYQEDDSIFWPIAPPCSGTLWPFNTTNVNGAFWRADVVQGDVWVHGTRFAIPPFDNSVQVTSTGDTIRPAIAEDSRERLHLAYTRLDTSAHPTAYHRFSDDDGDSFSDEADLGISNGTYPFVATDPDGGVLFAALVYLSGTSGPGNIYAYYWGPGTHFADVPIPIPIVDDTGTALEAQDTTFAFCFPATEDSKLVLSVIINGDTDTSEWQCASYEDPADPEYLSFKKIT